MSDKICDPPTNANAPTTVQAVSGKFIPPIESVVMRTINALIPPNDEPSSTVSCQRIMAYIRANFEFPGMTSSAVNGEVKAALARLEGRMTLVRTTGGGLRGSLRRGNVDEQKEGPAGNIPPRNREPFFPRLRSPIAEVSVITEEEPPSHPQKAGPLERRRSARIAARDKRSLRHRYSPY